MWQLWIVRIIAGGTALVYWWSTSYDQAEMEARAYCEARPQDCGIYID